MDTVTVSAARDTREPLTAPSDRGRLRVMTIYLATDMYLAARQRDGCSPKTIDRYRRILHKLGDMYPHIDVCGRVGALELAWAQDRGSYYRCVDRDGCLVALLRLTKAAA